MKWSELAGSSDGPTLPDSCFVFGLNKSGSTLMHMMVHDVCEQAYA